MKLEKILRNVKSFMKSKANRNRKQMLRIEVNKGGIERALKIINQR